MEAASHVPLWDFNSVLQFLRSQTAASISNKVVLGQHPDPPRLPPEEQKSPRLGNLDAVLLHLGKPIDIPRPKSTIVVYDGSSASTSPPGYHSTGLSSPPTDDALEFEDFIIKNKEVRFAEDVTDGTDSPKSKSLVRKEWKLLDVDELRGLVNSVDPIRGEGQVSAPDQSSRSRRRYLKDTRDSDFESEAEVLYFGKARISRISTPSAKLLTPAWVTPIPATPQPSKLLAIIPPDIPYTPLERAVILPFLTLTREEKLALLVRKLAGNFVHELPISRNPFLASTQVGGNISHEGVHVFIDASNIAIGFHDALKSARGIAKHEYTRRPALAFHSLAVILERGRPVAKRVICGSLNSAGQEPEYVFEARTCGYSVSTLKRVAKIRPIAPKKREGRRGFATSGASSGSEAYEKPEMTVGEQGVDEILHLNMCTSMLDTKEPSTIVLATGDAAEAEYSGGFKKYVELALERGWKVELVCWCDGMSSQWVRGDFTKRWAKQFSIIHLDEYREELLAEYVESQPGKYMPACGWTALTT